MNQVLSMFGSAGPEAFSKMACQMAPYFSTINPLITELRQDAATVQVPFCREITNHLGTVHAIAMCNAAELAAGMMTDVSIPAGLAERLKLQKGAPVTHSTANGRSQGYRTRLEQLKLGDIVLHDVRALVAPGLSGNQVLLGMSALKQLEFTQRDGTFTLDGTVKRDQTQSTQIASLLATGGPATRSRTGRPRSRLGSVDTRRSRRLPHFP